MSRSLLVLLTAACLTLMTLGCSASSPADSAPKAAATPTTDPRLAVYQSGASAAAQRYVAAMSALSTLSANPKPSDPTWRTQYRDRLADVKATGVAVRDLKPPPCMESTQAELLKAASALDQAADLMTAGVTAGNAAQIEAGGRLIADGGQYLKNATANTPASC